MLSRWQEARCSASWWAHSSRRESPSGAASRPTGTSPLPSTAVSSTGQAFRGNDGGLLGGNGAFGSAQDRLGTSGVGCGATAPAAPLGSRFRGNDDLAGLTGFQACWVEPPRSPGFPPARERRMSHPHPSPLPSRERGYGSREAGGHVGPPLRRLSRRACLFLASRERGCGSPARRGLCVLITPAPWRRRSCGGS